MILFIPIQVERAIDKTIALSTSVIAPLCLYYLSYGMVYESMTINFSI